MLNSITISGGYYVDLPHKPPFGERLTLLLGPNGSGKSTVAKTAAGLCGIKNGGWSRYYAWREFWKIHREDSYSFPKEYQKFIPKGIEAKVKWDKTPVFYYENTAALTGFSHFFDSADESPDGITTMDDQIGQMFQKTSAGQSRAGKLARALTMLKTRPELQKGITIKDDNKFPHQGNCLKAQVAYFQKDAKITKATVILDEPEANLDIKNQAIFWIDYVPKLCEKFQVIIASHSIFALAESSRKQKEHPTKIVEMTKGFLETAEATLKTTKRALA